ncbi:helix-turn-helix domain-containing protein [Nocardia sp. NPDC049220]|uniref:helix-turn-helix domain-containing protein n=1 Tax=Nocardia sp. NPDC049220 TaxID=3155273 RepID=UPI0033F63A58
MNGGTIDRSATEPLNVVLGSMIRELRRARKLKQWQTANLANVSLSAYSKWEEGTRRPLRENLDKLCKALDAEPWRYRKIMSLISESSPFGIDVRDSSPKITDEDIGVLEEFTFPALYRKLPECEIIYANQACLEIYPMFAPAPHGAARPANMIVAMLTDQRARKVFVDWDTVAHHMVYTWKHWSRGVVSERNAEIVAACERAAPEFEHMWNNEPPQSAFTNTVRVRRWQDPTTVDRYIQRRWFPNYQTGETGEYEIFATPHVRGVEARSLAVLREGSAGQHQSIV